MSPGESHSGDPIQVEDPTAPVLVTDEMGKLCYDEEHAALTRIDRSYVAVAAKAIEQNRDLALIYPSPPTYLQLPVLLAVGYHSRSCKTPPSLFVSNRSGAGIREQYFDVRINKGAGELISANSLADYTAPLVKTGDGRNLSHVTHHKPHDWDGDPRGVSVIHSTLGGKLATDFPATDELPLSAIVLDVTTKLLGDFADIERYQEHAAERGIPVLYLFDTPSHRHLDRIEQQNVNRDSTDQTLFWGYSHSTLHEAGAGVLDTEADSSVFDSSSITRDTYDQNSPFEVSIPVLRNIVNGINRDIKALTYSDLEPLSSEAYRKIQEVAGYVRNRRDSVPQSASFAIRDLYFTYSYLSTLPTSVEFHDDLMAFETGWNAGSTLDKMVGDVRKNYQRLESDVTGAGNMLEDACDALSRMRKQLVERNPKADQIASEIRDSIEREESIVILAATGKQTSVLRSFISEKVGIRSEDLESVDVEFHSLYDTHTVPVTDRLLFPGVPLKSHRPAVLSGVAPEQTYLAYEWELDRLRGRLESLEQLTSYRCGPAALRHTVDQLGVDYSGLRNYIGIPDQGHEPVPADTVKDRKQQAPETDSTEETESEGTDITTTHRQGVGGNGSESVGASDSAVEENESLSKEKFTPDTDVMENAAEYFDDGTEQETVNEANETYTPSDRSDIEAVKVKFEDGSFIFERAQGMVWVYSQKGTGEKGRTRKAAKALEHGDIVLITRQESRRDVFEHIVEKIRSEVPEFTKYSKMLEYWRTNLQRIVTENDISATDIAGELQDYADENDIPEASRQTLAVQDWIDKETIGPGDHEVIEALGEIYGIDIYSEMAVEIEASLDEIRNLHRMVGHHLDKILFSTGLEEDDDTWLFEEFNIRVEDVQDTVEYREVERVTDDTYEVSHRDLGRLFDR